MLASTRVCVDVRVTSCPMDTECPPSKPMFRLAKPSSTTALPTEVVRMAKRLTLDTLGIALLLVVVVVSAWPHIGRDVMSVSHQYGPYIAMLLGSLIAAIPLLGIWAEQSRRPMRLL